MKTLESPTNPHAAGKAAHTPTPWSVRASRNDEGYGLLICDEDQTILAGMDTWLGPTPEAEMEANAQFIVRACNSHAALVEAVERLLNQVTGPAQVYGDGIGNDGRKTGLSHWEFNELRDERIAFARAALQSATLEATP